MNIVFKKYKKFFKNLFGWTFCMALFHFVVFLLAFLLVCFAYTFIETPEGSVDSKTIFISKFVKYLTLTSAILFLIPFLLSLLLTFALLHKHQTLLKSWTMISIGFSSLFTIGLLSSGIYLAVEYNYVGYIVIVISLLFAALMVHSILLVYTLYTTYKNRSKSGNNNIHNNKDEDESSTANNEE